MNQPPVRFTGSGRILLAPTLKEAHSLWQSGKIDTGAWCAIFQWFAYGFPLPKRYHKLIKWR